MTHLYGTRVGGLLVDALHQLMADTALISVAGRWGWITEIDLRAEMTNIYCWFFF